MEVDVRVERPPESLHDGDGAATPVGDPSVPRLAPQKTEDRAHGSPHHGAAEGVIPGQPVTEAVRQTEHPLPHGHPREHMVDEMRGSLGHAPPPTARAETPPVTRKGHQAVEPAPRASEPSETSAEGATLQKATKLLLHEAGQALSVAEIGRLRPKRLEVVTHDLIQDA